MPPYIESFDADTLRYAHYIVLLYTAAISDDVIPDYNI